MVAGLTAEVVTGAPDTTRSAAAIGVRAQANPAGPAGAVGPAGPEGVARPSEGGPAAAEPFHGLVHEDVLLIAREGRDVEPLFIALLDGVVFDERAYAVRACLAGGGEVVFSKLAGQTEEFFKRLQENRALLSQESAALLAAGVPSVSPAARSVLAESWPCGRLLGLEATEALSPEFGPAFKAAWLANMPRRARKARTSWTGRTPTGCS